MDLRERLRGSLLAGAVGDALGAPLEFLSGAEIRRRWGPLGPDGYVAGSWPAGSITDDTQMTLFTAEGMIRARARGATHRGRRHLPSVVHRAYLRWLATQGDVRVELDGWLVSERVLHARRAPGNTCLSALQTDRMGTPEAPLNDSKGCGGVMRVAPAGIYPHTESGLDPFEQGAAYAAITHGHPSGYLAAGFQAHVIGDLLGGSDLEAAVSLALDRLCREACHEETLAAVEGARTAAARSGADPEVIPRLGGGWVGEEALAIGLYCALAEPDLRAALRLAVSHSGDSDSTGAIAGNLVGALQGERAIPSDLLDGLEARGIVERVADDLHLHLVETPPGLEARDHERYPGV